MRPNALGLRLTGRSSRTPEVPFPGRAVVLFPSGSDLRVGGRLNYGVRHHKRQVCLHMKSKATLTPRNALIIFVFAMCGSLTGTLVTLSVGTAFREAPQWLLPAIAFASVLLAIVAGYAGLHLATSRTHYRANAQDSDA